ncbi:MAG TPA: gluconate 2-dehydrogenase subunit 3 family protein [Bryobacteraceae bacterium]|nr:gluconate 2-dehydrogenase subunit 3 family protein [Bryobacteraceae bacterium]
MHRRTLIQTLLGVSVSGPFRFELAAQEEIPKLALAAADAASEAIPRFLAPAEFAAFRHLGTILMPASEVMPGAAEAEAAEFLDFLLFQSDRETQTLYRRGIEKLQKDAMAQGRKSFVSMTDAEAAPLLAPLQNPWTYEGPAEPYAKFLQAAKLAFWQATLNSRQWATASAGRTRRGAGLDTYWLPIE